MRCPVTRSGARLFCLLALLPAALAVGAPTAPAATGQRDATAPRLLGFRASTADRRAFAGDGRLLTTVSANRDRLRAIARVRAFLTERATVVFEVTRTDGRPEVVHTVTATLRRGWHAFTWYPPPNMTPRTYLTRFTATDPTGNRRVYGPRNAESGRVPTTPVIRVLGIDAGFTRESYAPGENAEIRIETDAKTLELQVFHAGPETVPTYDNTVLNGVPVTAPRRLDWWRFSRGAGSAGVRVGDWQSGLYYVRLTGKDGRIGYAPFIVRPRKLGLARVAVVLPTNTWQAYNFRDEDGNGFGDTWYAKGAQSTVRLGRAYLRRGVPPQYRKYDLGFLRWLAQRGKAFDALSETDLESISTGDVLAARYDLIVMAGHHEYVTVHEYDSLQRFRDLGGNLAFLGSNNLFWQVLREGPILRRTVKWRDAGRPEAALVGVQYRANDDGRTQRPYVVRGAAALPWLFAGTGLQDGTTFGPLGGYGIEIDATTPSTPPGAVVAAEIPDIFGPGLTAQMSYYETPAGAKVFAAGAMDFGGTALEPPVSQILENLWQRLAAP